MYIKLLVDTIWKTIIAKNLQNIMFHNDRQIELGKQVDLNKFVLHN